MTLMICATVALCALFLRNCDHRTVNVSCDIKQSECQRYLDRLTEHK
jgi:hypothetical protein